MINQVLEVSVQCPYCWQEFILLVDGSIEFQEYTEDCEVCCRPIDLTVQMNQQNQAMVQVQHE